MTELNLLFGGDFAPCRRFEPIAIERRGRIFGQLREEIEAADFAIVNLETPLCPDGGVPIAKVGPNLRADPATAAALADAGVGVVGLANNHILDFGSDGLASTLENCALLNIMTCGAGTNSKEANKPLLLSRSGMTVALIAMAEQEFNAASYTQPGAAILDTISLIEQIRAVKSKADVVVVTIHGGNEYFPYPRPGLRRLARHAVEMGADAVLCHHSHVPGATETYQGKPIHYSLGNLIFDASPAPKDWQLGYAVALKFIKSRDGAITVNSRTIPFTQSVALEGIQLLAGHELEAFSTRMEGYRQTLENDAEWLNEWRGFCRQQRLSYITAQYLPVNFPGIGRLVRLLSLDRFLLPKTTINQKKNLLRCESHRELLISMLELE